jgi:translation initiation factor 2 beta subunit (eIF-2beta)/eIF-5
MSFRDTSIKLTKSLTKQVKQDGGIFFTPKEDRDKLFAILDRFKVRPTSVLEPSFGSGEFLEDLYEKYPATSVTGVELNSELFSATKRESVYNMNFLDYMGKHDLIVGNPPFFVMEKNEETVICQDNRPNMFVQFLYKALEYNLADGGVLAFILPKSFYNCSYYEKMRRYLAKNTTILAVEPLDGKYIETQQATFILVVREAWGSSKPSNFLIERGDSIYLTPCKNELLTLLKKSSTLTELGFEVKTGDVVWNQEKEKMSDDGTLLLYSTNLKNGKVELGVKEPKKQYIRGFERPPLSGKAILINRGYGNSAYTLSAVLVEYPSFYAENHVNVVRPKTPKAEELIKKVYHSLQSNKTAKFIQIFVGNSALSKTEIERILPIWLDDAC